MEYFPSISPFGDRKSPSSLVFEEFVPPSAWTEDQTHHYLLVDLPGFKRQELKLQVDNQTHIVVSGERQVRENNYKRFEQRFELPNNADTEKITGKLDGEILYISVPKIVEHEHQETKHPPLVTAQTLLSDVDENEEEEEDDKSDENEDKSDHIYDVNRNGFDENWGKEADLFIRLAVEKLRKNKGIVVTAIFAFSLGVLVTQKFQSNGN